MTRDFAIWVSLVAAGAGCMVLHVWLLMRAVRARQLSRALRWAALFPPVTPIAAWHAGARKLTLAWAGTGIVYCALRLMAAVNH